MSRVRSRIRPSWYLARTRTSATALGYGDESPQRRLLLAPDPGAQVGVDEVALVDLTAALPAHGHFSRRERGHELVASEQLADEDCPVAAVGLDDP
jgi:hypothetical protein